MKQNEWAKRWADRVKAVPGIDLGNLYLGTMIKCHEATRTHQILMYNQQLYITYTTTNSTINTQTCHHDSQYNPSNVESSQWG